VVDTGPWIFGKKVLLPAGTIDRVDSESGKLYVDLTKDQIKDSPSLTRAATTNPPIATGSAIITVATTAGSDHPCTMNQGPGRETAARPLVRWPGSVAHRQSAQPITGATPRLIQDPLSCLNPVCGRSIMSCQEPSPPHRLGCGLQTMRNGWNQWVPYTLGALKLLVGSLSHCSWRVLPACSGGVCRGRRG
jgi:hypothetical protein